MPTMGFIRRDFDVFAIADFSARLAKIDEPFANLLRAELAMVQVGDEADDRALEVDIVLPKRVVGVEQQGLAGRKSSDGFKI